MLPDSLVGRVLGGRYRVLGLLGEGGMGAVYVAMQEDLQRRVAVKVLSSEGTSLEGAMRLRQEAFAAAELRHPNIVQVTDFQALPGEPPFLVMEMLEGESLSTVLGREAPLPPARAVFIATQILAALEVAHASRVVHRDIKPANVFLSRTHAMTDIVKVLDFGIAKVVGERAVGPRTQTGSILGTPAYMSPEQVVGAALDERTDLHAVGICLFEMLSGVRPYDATTGGEMMMVIARRPPVRLLDVNPHVDPALADIVMRSIAKDPAARFPSAVAMLEALAPFRGPASGPAPSPRAPGSEGSARGVPTISATSPAVVLQGLSPSAPPHGAAQTTPPGRATSLVAIAAASAAIVFVVGAGALFAVHRVRTSGEAGGGGDQRSSGSVFGGPAAFDSAVALIGAQLVGDSSEDLVAWSGGGGGGSKNAVVVYDGSTFARAWSLPIPAAPLDHAIAVAGTRVVVNRTPRQVSVVDGATGKILRDVALPAVLVSLCAPTGATRDVWLELTKQQWHTLDVETGALRETRTAPAGCAPSDISAATFAELDRAAGSAVAPRTIPTIRGWTTKACGRAAVCTERSASAASLSEGLTDGATVVAMTGDSREGVTIHGLDDDDATRWKKELAPSSTGDPIVDLVAGRLFVQEVSSSFALDALDPKTGARLWRYEATSSVLGGQQGPVHRSGAGASRLYLYRGDRIEILDLATGRLLGKVGG